MENGDLEDVNASPTDSYSSCICTNILVCFTYFCYGAGTICSQLTQVSVLQVNCARFVIIPAVTLFTHCIWKYPLEINRQIFVKLAACSILHFVSTTCYYLTATFMPVGNLNGLEAAFGTVLATGYDFYRKKIKKLSIVSATLAVVGVILLAQPWAKKDEVHFALAPCEYLQNSSQPLLVKIANNTLDQQQYAGNGLQNWLNGHKDIFPYLILVIISVSAVTRGVLIREVLAEYPVQTILFWHVTLAGFFSLILNQFSSQLFDASFFEVPPGTLCWVLTLLYIAITGCGTASAFFTYKRTHVSTTEITDIALTVALYICQRTLLKQFHPGHANATEIVGIVIIIFSVPIMHLFSFLIYKGDNA